MLPAVQTIQEVAKTVGHLTVFQRTPKWCAPLHNGKIGADEMRQIRANYPEILARCAETPGCFIHAPDPRATFEVTPQEREAFWEKLYGEPGFGIWQGNFRDILVDREANALVSDFIARKIRQRVKDPAVAEKLIPKNHGFGTRRVPLETRYYEVYNQPNVKLVDINETPIERITPAGIKTSDAEYEFDMIIYATGFDAITGSFDRIDIRGIDGQRLKDKWQAGPQTYLGILVEGFPNMLMVMGPHAGLGNFPRAAEYSVEWVTGLVRFAHERGLTRIEATAAGVADWTDHVKALGEGLLMNEIEFMDDRRQPQRRGQADPQDHALQRRPPCLPRALRRGGRRRLSQAGAGLDRPHRIRTNRRFASKNEPARAGWGARDGPCALGGVSGSA